MKVLISGGGIAGGATAYWLSKLGHDITIVERFSSLRTTGLQIDLRGHGIEVMKRMGIEQAFRSISCPEQGLQIVDKSGRRRAYFPVNTSGKGPQSFSTEWEIMRGDFCRLLHNVTKDKTTWIFGTSVKSFVERDKCVEVEFTNGNTDRFDLLVGADGLQSRTRKMMLGSDTNDGFHPLPNLYVAYFVIPKEGKEYIATQYIATKQRGIMTRRSNPRELQVYVGCTSKSERFKNLRNGDVREEKAALTECFQGAGWQTEELLKGMNETDNFYLERMGLVKLDSWSRGRVTLVGDAGYSPTAQTGMGTTSAIVGAYILAGEISKHCGRGNAENKGEDGLAKALKGYEEKFRPFMDQVQEGVTADSPWDMVSSIPFGIAIFNCFMGLLSLLKVDPTKYMLREKIKNWDLPEYQELLQD